jgi:4-amino-4-deoxychorismate lyase
VLRKILVETVAASHCKNGSLRYWISAGPGDFNLSSKQCKEAAFYAIVLGYNQKLFESVSVITSSIPLKPPMFATMKNVNYLPNVLSLLEAEEKGAYTSIWVDDEGYVAEGPNMNVAFVNQIGELIMPSFDKILSGCTALRTLALADQLLASEPWSIQLKGVRTCSVKVEEGKAAAEMMLIGSGNPIVPVIKWDEQQIGNGNAIAYIYT